MNYRHAFHAGNFADVVKHIALIAIVLHLRRKETPFCVVDSHAGNGLYSEVDICSADGTIETIQNPAEPSPVGTT